MRLDVALVNARRLEFPLNDHIGLFETLGDIPLLELQMSRDIRRLGPLLAHGVSAQLRQQNGCVRLHRIDENSAEADARTYIDELNRVLGLNLPEDAGYDTLGGFVTTTVGRIPPTGTTFAKIW